MKKVLCSVIAGIGLIGLSIVPAHAAWVACSFNTTSPYDEHNNVFIDGTFQKDGSNFRWVFGAIQVGVNGDKILESGGAVNCTTTNCSNASASWSSTDPLTVNLDFANGIVPSIIWNGVQYIPNGSDRSVSCGS